MDKMLVSPDGDVIITNDGATILEKMEIHHQTAKLLAELSASQDNEIGDGTTGVVVLAGAILEQAQKLLDKGIHPLKIADGFEQACEIAVKKIQEISQPIDIKKNDFSYLRQCATTALGSKVVSKCQDHFADLAVKSVLHVADLDRKDVNFDLIKIIAKPKTKHGIEIKTVDDYEKLQKMEQDYFTDMVKKVKDSGANVVLCQWGFDDEANHLLMQNELPSVRWVGGVEIELLAIATNGRIIPRFEEITPEKLGKAGLIKEIAFGTSNERVILI
jgi:T-complex protein 1 subunit epsilon